MRQDGGHSRATPDGQMLAFVEGLTSLTGRRRAVARVVCAGVLVAGGAAVTFAAVRAFTGAFA